MSIDVPLEIKQATLDALRWPAVAVDAAGLIVAHNAEWTRLQAEGVGASYFAQVASDALATQLRALVAREVGVVEGEGSTPFGPYRVRAMRLGTGALVFHELLQGEVANTSLVNAAFEFDTASRYLLSPDAQMLAVNRVARESVQRLRGRVMRAGDSLWDVVSPDTRLVGEEGLRRALQGEAWTNEREITFPTGVRTYQSRFEPVRDAAGAIFAVHLSVLDVTENRSVEEARVANQRLSVLRRLADQVPAMLGYWDQDLRCGFANSAYEVFFGRRAAEVMQLTLPELLGPRLYALNRRYIEGALAGVPQRFEREIADPQGGPPRISEASYTPDVVDGVVQGFFVVVADVTKRHALELELRQAHKMEAVGQLSSGIAHDFNNLLTVMLSSADHVRESVPPDSLLLEDVDAIVEAGRRAAALTKQLLAFGRRTLVAPQVVELGPLLSRMGSMVRRLVREDIRIEVTPGSAGRVRADPSQLEQLVMNLVLNAQDAMPTGGVLHLETGWTDVAAGDPVLVPGRYATLTVKDSGKGMDEATLQRAFEPFFTTKPIGEAHGLGLSTVYSIARQAGGVVRAKSAPGKGSTFTVWLPLVEAPSQPVVPTRASPVVGHETILFVEDEELISMMTTRLLKAAGYQVLSAHTGEEALRLLRETSGPVDLLLTDVVMPGLSGPELAKRALAERPAMRVLYCSGYTDDIALRNGVQQGTAHFLPKPYSADTLRAKVREVLDLPG